MQTPSTYFASKKRDYVERLKQLSRVPSISSSKVHKGEVRACAESVRRLCLRAGLAKAELVELDGAHPYVYAEHNVAKESSLSERESLVAKIPTVLLYSHYDVQPTGDEKLWHSPPFAPEERGGRLYGRGTADDKAGIIAHLAAIESYLKTTGRLPVNIKCLFEGEEEIGSVNLTRLLKRYRSKFKADYLIIADTENFDIEIPGITTQLRGLVDLDVELKALSQPVHSGQWGGPVPDPAQGLAKLLSGLTDDDGRIAVPGVYDDVKILSAKERTALKKLPFNLKRFREHAKFLSTTKMSGESGFTPHELIWHRPAISVNAIQASAREKVSNIIVESAWAHLGLRLVPNMSPKKTMAQLVKFLKARAPKNMKLEIKPGHLVPWWRAEAESEALRAAKRAAKAGFGREAVIMGSGGSIGFVEPFSKALGGAPAILLGVEDPECNAHSYNESLHLDNWYKTVDSLIRLFSELGKIGK